MSRASQRGVTLIELVIAISLVALLSVGMLFAMRVGLVAMDRSNATLMANRKVASVQRILEGQVSNLMPVPALCGTAGEGPHAKIGFFQGELQALRFVSSYSLHEGDRGLPHILEYQVIPGENGTGVRLVVNERTYTGPLSVAGLCMGERNFRAIETGPMSFVLADKIAYCRFSFKEHMPPYGDGQWLARWNKPFFPLAIRVEMAPIDPSLGRLQLLTLTMPVRINRDPLVRYDF